MAILKYSLDCKTLVFSIQPSQPFSRFWMPLGSVLLGLWKTPPVQGVGGLSMTLCVYVLFVKKNNIFLWTVLNKFKQHIGSCMAYNVSSLLILTTCKVGTEMVAIFLMKISTLREYS